MLKRILAISLSLYSFTSFSQVNIGNIEKEYISNGKAFSSYDELFQGSRKYQTKDNYSKFSLLYDDEKNKISGENGLNSDKSAEQLWKKKYFESIYFMFNGFIDHPHDRKSIRMNAIKEYRERSKDFFAKKSHGLYSQMTTADYAFNYNMIGVLKAFVNSQNILKECDEAENKEKCISISADKLKVSNDLFEKVYGNCLNENNDVMNKCIVKTIDTTDFSKSMAFENYIVGNYLSDITNNKK